MARRKLGNLAGKKNSSSHKLHEQDAREPDIGGAECRLVDRKPEARSPKQDDVVERNLGLAIIWVAWSDHGIDEDREKDEGRRNSEREPDIGGAEHSLTGCSLVIASTFVLKTRAIQEAVSLNRIRVTSSRSTKPELQLGRGAMIRIFCSSPSFKPSSNAPSLLTLHMKIFCWQGYDKDTEKIWPPSESDEGRLKARKQDVVGMNRRSLSFSWVVLFPIFGLAHEENPSRQLDEAFRQREGYEKPDIGGPERFDGDVICPRLGAHLEPRKMTSSPTKVALALDKFGVAGAMKFSSAVLLI
ncbi:hypothetical protein C8R47DRAFT_1068583 [Mycena vitilis]|nr:hypothetical protein C8R47DRAFT_1068583 [Mycena vitilis]